jgi:hypothetical protein
VNREGSRKGVTDGRRDRRSDDATNSDAPAKKKRSGGGDSEDSEDGEEADDDKDVRDVGARTASGARGAQEPGEGSMITSKEPGAQAHLPSSSSSSPDTSYFFPALGC